MISLANEGHFDVVYFFGDSSARNSSYQLIQWIQPLERVCEHLSVCVLLRDPALASHIPPGSPLTHRVARSPRDIENFLRSTKPSMVLYSNQMLTNFFPLGFNEAAHIFLSHGESDKPYNSQRVSRMFDFLFLAGPIAKERVLAQMPDFGQERIKLIGRPQLLDNTFAPEHTPSTSRAHTIIYAPTYEGFSDDDALGSVVSHGKHIVSSILRNPTIRLIYRPHPLTGSRKTEWATAHKNIVNAITAANIHDPAAGHFYDDSPWGWQLGFADAMVSDISAVAYDWLSTGKPLLITKPEAPRATPPSTGFTSETTMLDTASAPMAADLLSELLTQSEESDRLATWSRRYFSPNVGPGTGEEVLLQELKAIKALVQKHRAHSMHPQTPSTSFETTPQNESSPLPKTVAGPQFSTFHLSVWLKREIKKRIYPFLRRILTQHLRNRTSKLSQNNNQPMRPIIYARGKGAGPERILQAWKFVTESSNLHCFGKPVIAVFALKDFVNAAFWLPFASKLKILPSQVVLARTGIDSKVLVDRLNCPAIFYNQLSPANTGFLNIHGPEHILLWPERDHAAPTHHLVAFDHIVCDSSEFTRNAEKEVFWLHQDFPIRSSTFAWAEPPTIGDNAAPED